MDGLLLARRAISPSLRLTRVENGAPHFQEIGHEQAG
jgi:hypothetical protein